MSAIRPLTKILVIDHDPAERGQVVNWLSGEGFDVLGAENGIAGVKYAYDYMPQLILCDIGVPHLDGYGVLFEIRSNPITADTPIIFFSASQPEKTFSPLAFLGANDFITKPFTQAQLLQAVQSRLEKKSLEQQELQRKIIQLEQALASEQEQRLLKAKMVAIVAHDFRNPLASILSSNNLLRDYADRMSDERRLIHMNRIEGSVRLLLSMLDEMLVLAEIDSRSLVFTPEPLNVGLFVQRIVEEFQLVNIDSHKIVFDNHVPETIMADSRLLQQIVSNLISNAVKYSPSEGTVNVTLDKNDEQMILTISDHGLGISEADQRRLFYAFQRGSNVGATPGTGLGLTIVKRAVELYQGDIQVESQIGSGTTMIVLLPTNRAETPAEINPIKYNLRERFCVTKSATRQNRKWFSPLSLRSGARTARRPPRRTRD